MNEAKAAMTGAAAMSAELERVKENLRHAEGQLAEWKERHADAKREVERRGQLLDEAEVRLPLPPRSHPPCRRRREEMALAGCEFGNPLGARKEAYTKSTELVVTPNQMT